MTEANRWLLYAALFGVLVLLLQDDRLGAVVVGRGRLRSAPSAIYLLARMLAGSAEELFLAGRLNEPLGYVNGQAGYLLIGVWPLVALAERARQSAARARRGRGRRHALLGLVLLGQTRAVVPALLRVGRRDAGVSFPGALGGRGRSRPSHAASRWRSVRCSRCTTPLAAGPPHPDDGVIREAAARDRRSGAVVAGGALGGGDDARAGAAGTVRRAQERRALAWAPLVVAALVAVVRWRWPQSTTRSDASATSTAPSCSSTPSGSSSSRFTTGAGNRYDYWRIAWNQFRDDPPAAAWGPATTTAPTSWSAERPRTSASRTASSSRRSRSSASSVAPRSRYSSGRCFFGFARRARAARRAARRTGPGRRGGWRVPRLARPHVRRLAAPDPGRHRARARERGRARRPVAAAGRLDRRHAVRRTVVVVLAVVIVLGAALGRAVRAG